MAQSNFVDRLVSFHLFFCTVLLGTALLLGCGGDDTQTAENDSSGSGGPTPAHARSGRSLIKIDGSSTVAPMSAAVAELFQAEHPDIRVTVGISGTGGGFKKFLDPRADLRTDINDASRTIKPAEMQQAERLGIAFIELPIVLDGIAVVVHPHNDFCDHLTVEELKRMWEPDSEVDNWNQVRAGFPDLPLKLYGPGPDSGTFDYFTEAIVGKEKASRSDYTMSEDDNVLVQGVAGDPGGLGYFGFAYFHENRDRLKLLGIDPGNGTPVQPSLETIRGGIYRPLSRPLLLYVNAASAKRPEVAAFMAFYYENAAEIAQHPRIGYVPLPENLYPLLMERFHKGTTGSLMVDLSPEANVNLYELYAGQ